MDDPYKVLGVKRDASQDEIRRAYRRLAKRYHPDLNPGKPEAEKRFKDVAAAYDLLSDPEKRARFDRGEIDASGAERPDRAYYRDFGEGWGGAKYSSGEAAGGAEEMEDLFSQIFGGGMRTGSFRMRGGDLHLELPIGFLEAARGGSRRITLPDGRTLEITIPAGIDDGRILRLKGQGGPGIGGGPPGDALVEIRVQPHPVFRRDGDDIRITLPVTLAEAVLGGRIRVPTIDGVVMMAVPKRSDSGTVLRLKGKGLPRRDGTGRGDQYVELRIVLGDTVDEELERFLADWAPKHPHDPRQSMVRP